MSMNVYCPACGTSISVSEEKLYRGFGTACVTCETWLEFSMDGEEMVVRAGP